MNDMLMYKRVMDVISMSYDLSKRYAYDVMICPSSYKGGIFIETSKAYGSLGKGHLPLT